MIRKVTLKNFMSHADTVIELADGLTVLTGPNNCGKSALVSALQILASNGKTTHVTRHGEKLCQVSVETDDGHTILWERKKDTVKYQINGEDIHRVGQTIPAQLHDHLRLDQVTTETGATKTDYDIHFGDQKSPIFLLGESGSRAAAFFASSSDASRLIEMQNKHRARQQDNRREKKRLTAEIETNRLRHAKLEPLDAIRAKITAAEKLHAEIAIADQRQNDLKKKIATIEADQQSCTRLTQQTQILEQLDSTSITPEQLQNDRDTCKQLKSIATRLQEIQRERLAAIAAQTALQELEPPPPQHTTTRLQTLIRDLQATIQQKSIASATARSCETLTPPPQPQDTQHLRSQIAGLNRYRGEIRSAQSQLNCLDPLTIAPELNSSQPLQQRLKQLKTTTADHQSKLQAVKVFDDLIALEPLADPTNLKTLLNRLKSQKEQSRDAAKSVATAEQNLNEHETALREFVSKNPTCETCGSSIDPETLLSAMPLGHAHQPRI